MGKHGHKKNLSDIESIYKDYDARFQRGGSGFGRVIISLMLFIALAGVTMAAGYYVFHERGAEDFRSEDISLELKGNDRVVSGEEIFYVIKYRNNSRVAYSDVEVSFVYPKGFILNMAEPPAIEEENVLAQAGLPAQADLSGSRKWHFDKIKEGEDGEIKIKGMIVGEISDEKDFRVSLKYNPVNTGAYFTERTGLTAVVEDKFLDLSIEGDGKFNEGEKNGIKVRYKNNAASSLRNIKLFAYFPNGAKVFLDGSATAAPLVDAENGARLKYELEIEELAGKADEELDMGVILSNTSDYGATFRFQIGYLDNEKNFILQEEEIYSAAVLKGSLSVNLLVNESEKSFADLGDSLKYSLVLENSGDIVFRDIRPRVIIDDSEEILNWESLAVKDGEFSDSEIFWDKESVIELDEMEKGEKIELYFSVDLKDKSDISLKDIMEGKIISWAEVVAGQTGTMGGEKNFKSDSAETNLTTDLELTSQLRYFSEQGDSIGSGPMPPRVGEATSYKVFLKLANTLNEVKNVKIEASLTDDAIWRERTALDSGELYFDRGKNSVVWTIPNLPENLSAIQGVFEISIEPKAEDAGKSVMLIKGVSMTAVDGKTGAAIEKSYGPLTTADEASGGRGVVGF